MPRRQHLQGQNRDELLHVCLTPTHARDSKTAAALHRTRAQMIGVICGMCCNRTGASSHLWQRSSEMCSMLAMYMSGYAQHGSFELVELVGQCRSYFCQVVWESILQGMLTTKGVPAASCPNTKELKAPCERDTGAAARELGEASESAERMGTGLKAVWSPASFTTCSMHATVIPQKSQKSGVRCCCSLPVCENARAYGPALAMGGQIDSSVERDAACTCGACVKLSINLRRHTSQHQAQQG